MESEELRMLRERAQSVVKPTRLNGFLDFGGVGAALLGESGEVYVGVCIDTSSSLGMCAEVAAVASMLSAGETRVLAVVAVGERGVMPPCGKCREFLSQMGGDPLVLVGEEEVVRLSELLLWDWKRDSGRAL